MKALRFSASPTRLAFGFAASRSLPAFCPSRLGPLQLVDLPDPMPADPQWKVLSVRYCGLCGSDRKEIYFETSATNPMSAVVGLPHVIGHEVVGEVDGVPMVVDPWLSCLAKGISPQCKPCQAGRAQLCLHLGANDTGLHAGASKRYAGGFAERTLVHQTQLHRIPDGVSWEQAALADPAGIAIHAINQCPPGPTVLVIGCGAIGLLLICLVRRLHPNTEITAVATFANQQRLARLLGADRVVQPEDPIAQHLTGAMSGRVMRPLVGSAWLWGDTYAVVYDTVGSSASTALAIRTVGSGGLIARIGLAEPNQVDYALLTTKEACIRGLSGYAGQPSGQHPIDSFLAMVAEGSIHPELIITHRFPLSQYRKAFAIYHGAARTQAVKVLLHPDQLASQE